MAISSVKIYARIKKRDDATGPYSQWRLGFYNDDTYSYVETDALDAAWTTVSKTWTTNPYTGLAWQEDELAALKVYWASIGDNRSGFKRGAYWTWIYLEEAHALHTVTYNLTAAAAWSAFLVGDTVYAALSDFDEADSDTYVYHLGTVAGGTWATGTSPLSAVSGAAQEYPTDVDRRVTSIVHRYDRLTTDHAVYNMEFTLGQVVADFGLPVWLSRPQSAIPDNQPANSDGVEIPETVDFPSVKEAISSIPQVKVDLPPIDESVSAAQTSQNPAFGGLNTIINKDTLSNIVSLDKLGQVTGKTLPADMRRLLGSLDIEQRTLLEAGLREQGYIV